MGGGRKVSASVCRLNFRVIGRAPTRARNGRSAAAPPVTIRCGCWVLIRPALGGRADWRALPKWCPSSPAAMCRHRTGDVMARDVRCEKTFSLRVPWRATPPALSPPGEKRRQGTMVPQHPDTQPPEAPLDKGSCRRRRLRGQPLKTSGNSQNSRTPHLLPITYSLLPITSSASRRTGRLRASAL